MRNLTDLFTSDHVLAKKAIYVINERQAKMVHWLLNLGEYSIIEEELRKGKLSHLSFSEILGIRFRLERRKGNKIKAYKKVLTFSEEMKEKIVEKAKESGILLTGGIGDHLQEISTLIHWYKKNKTIMRIKVKEDMRKIIEKLISINDGIEIASTKDGIQSSWLISSIDERDIVTSSFLATSEKKKVGWEMEILCCWQATGKSDKMSRWIRSVNSQLVYDFYKSLIQRGIEPSRIVDISNWKTWEKTTFENLGIKMVNPEEGDVNDIKKLIDKCKKIISIDTALVHLAAALDRKVYLLQAKYPDERWTELLSRDNSYTRNCRVVKQEKYGTWHKTMNNLKKII